MGAERGIVSRHRTRVSLHVRHHRHGFRPPLVVTSEGMRRLCGCAGVCRKRRRRKVLEPFEGNALNKRMSPCLFPIVYEEDHTERSLHRLCVRLRLVEVWADDSSMR